MLHPTASEIAYMHAHASDDRRGWLVGATVALLVLAYLAVAMRVMSRRKMGTSIGVDDCLIIASAFMVTGHVVCLIIAVRLGMGRHIIFVADAKSFAITALVAQTFYHVCIATIKLSIICLYGRIFQLSVPWFRPTLVATGVFLILVMVPQCLTYLLRCVPVDSLWTDYGPKAKILCINFQATIVAFGIINIISDWFILFLPIPIVLSLQLERRAKWSICSLFLIGGFVCVISIIRSIYSSKVETADVSWNDVPISLISTAELSSGVLAACVPTWRPLFKFLCRGITSFLSSSPHNRSQSNGLSRGASSTSKRGRWVERARSKSRSRSRHHNRKAEYDTYDTHKSSTLSAGLERLGVGATKRSESSLSWSSMEGILKHEGEALEMSNNKRPVMTTTEAKKTPAPPAILPPAKTKNKSRVQQHSFDTPEPNAFQAPFARSATPTYEVKAGADRWEGLMKQQQLKNQVHARERGRSASPAPQSGAKGTYGELSFGGRAGAGERVRRSEDSNFERAGGGGGGWRGSSLAGLDGIVVTTTVDCVSGKGDV